MEFSTEKEGDAIANSYVFMVPENADFTRFKLGFTEAVEGGER